MTNCRSCETPIKAFMSFGQQPLANALQQPGRQESVEKFYELAPAVCPNCQLFQLINQPPPKTMFTERYPFLTSSSRSMTKHFEEFALNLMTNLPEMENASFVVEIGSNDGTLLQPFARSKIKHLGIEPSPNVADVAIKRNLNTKVAFFNSDTASEIYEQYGPADLIIAANVIGHIPDIIDLGRGVAKLLGPDGKFVFEAVYLSDVLRNVAFDQLYDEHVFTFSATSVLNVFKQHGLELVKLEHQNVHGGSMRFYLAHRGRHPVDHSVPLILHAEEKQGLDSLETYYAFKLATEKIRHQLTSKIIELNDHGASVTGYGATAKSTTILNYCDLGPDHIEWIQDSTKEKQGLLTPGSHIPIVSQEVFRHSNPDYAVLFAWNHRAEIEEKEKKWRASGGKWITYVPKVNIE
ncbi:MAG: SAM-dependent methyltransferase [Rhodospirillaceae bacterium]|nr:SAM-dependent methyltransferase [Rhodospirillaceae bacterium]|tara:strand:+ start:1755 stop:2978 length:1224 start_codon:yes stop_codon:yes gene_type:complete